MSDVVRHAVRADLDELEHTLVDAFFDDPMTVWMYPDPTERGEGTAAFLRAMLDLGLPHGHTYALGAHNEAVAIWAPPDVELFDDAGVARLGPVFEAMGERGAEVATGLLQISSAHPHDRGPHFYLSVLGTRTASQGKGLGSVLIAEVLERCDRQGVGAYLESSNTRNVPFYERHGFQVLSEIALSEEFVARPMWRDPR
jgi:GNAT superfamily N-acetyltransferase